MTDDITPALDAVRFVLTSWLRGAETHEQLRRRLGDALTPDFRVATLFTSLDAPLTYSNVVLSESDRSVARVFVTGTGRLYDPVLVVARKDHGRWRVRSLTSLCTGCIGSGMLGEDEWPSVCTVCGGTGWGTLDTNP